jgi:hypothetical protein
MESPISAPRKLAFLPNQDGFEFIAVYKDGTEKLQSVAKVEGIHTTANFCKLVSWKNINQKYFLK